MATQVIIRKCCRSKDKLMNLMAVDTGVEGKHIHKFENSLR